MAPGWIFWNCAGRRKASAAASRATATTTTTERNLYRMKVSYGDLAYAARRLDWTNVRGPTVSTPEQGGPGPTARFPPAWKESRMTRFLVRCASLAFAMALLVVGTGRADARDDDDGGVEAKNMKLVGFNDLQARSAYQPIVHEQG